MLLEPFLELAAHKAKFSNCKKAHFGAVLFGEHGEVLGAGYNWSVMPQLCCQRENLVSGASLERCGAIHAEQAAVLICLQNGRNPAGATVAVWGNKWVGKRFYCSLCARMLLYTGVKNVLITGRGLVPIEDIAAEAYGVGSCVSTEAKHLLL